MPILTNQRHLFDLPGDIAWFNNASRTPFLKTAADAGTRGMDMRRRVWTWDADGLNSDAEAIRGLFAGLIGAGTDDIAIQPAASYGLATAAANLSITAGQSIIVLQDQFPSNVFIWMEKAEASGARIVTVPRPADGDWTAAVLDHLDGDTAIVTLPPCHWSDGTRVDLITIGTRCRELGAALVVDATQWVGAAPFDVGRVQPDFLIAAAYKWLFCPHGMALMYAAPHRQSGQPLEHHDYNHPGTAASIEGALKYDPAFPSGARRYDVGQTFDPIRLPLARAALQQVADWGPENVWETLTPIAQNIIGAARDMGYSTPPPAHASPHITAIAKETPPPPGMIKAMEKAGVYASLRGGRLRLAPHVFNSGDDIRRLRSALKSAWP